MKLINNHNSNLSASKVFTDIVYAQCWEDPSIDRKAFKINNRDVIFSITSGGCNVLAFLTDCPEKIISLDLNPYQNYLLDLKIAAFRSLDYHEVLQFLGVEQSSLRLNQFNLIKKNLCRESAEYWNSQPGKIEMGVIHSGRYERYMHLLKNWLGILVGRSIVSELFSIEESLGRINLYEQKWNNFRWKIFTKLFLSRFLMSLLFTKKFFDQLEDSFSFGDHFRTRIKRALTELPLKENPFLTYILFGNYSDHNGLPIYLREENFVKIKEGLDRIEIITGNCYDYFKTLPENSISKFNFTNIFEWIPVNIFEEILKETIRVGMNESVITYRNLLVPRSRPESLSSQIIPMKEVSMDLLNQDLSFIYRSYIVEKIVK